MSARRYRTAVVALHYQNEVLHPDGKIKVGLSADSPERARVIRAAGSLLAQARSSQTPIVHVRVAYRPDYADVNQNAPIFRNVVKIGAAQEGEWGSQFFDELAPDPASPIEFVVKHSRINAFYGSQLEEVLKIIDPTHLVISGVATHSVVESTVRHAVDVGYEVTVAADACAAASPATHEASLQSMKLIADIQEVSQLESLFTQRG